MTDGNKPRLRQQVPRRGTNKVGTENRTASGSNGHRDSSINPVRPPSTEANKKSYQGPSSLHLLAINGDRDKLQEALHSSLHQDIDEVDHLSRTPLIYAVLGDRVECVALLLKHRANINIADIDERTPLHWSAYQGNHKLVKYLLAKGADKVRKDKEGRTPLHLSTSHDNIKVMQTLLHSMKLQEIDSCDNNNLTALSWSVFYDRIDYVRLLLRHGADTQVLDNESRSILHWTIQNKQPNILQMLIDHNSSLIDWVDNQRRTVLHLAVGRSNIALVRYLLGVTHKSAIDIKNKTDKMGRTPLHWAAVLGETDIVTLLLKHGADHTLSDSNGAFPLHYAAQTDLTDNGETVRAMVETRGITDRPDNDKATALMWAAVKGSAKVLEILLEKQCSQVDTVDINGQTALHKCTQAGHLLCVRVLIRHGSEVNICDKERHTPLFLACATGHRDIVEELLLNGTAPHLDDKDTDGKCPIHYAAARDRIDIINILLKHNSSVDAQDNEGCTPLHLSASLGLVHCISLLLENKADVEKRDNAGRTALHLACASGYVDAVKLLISRFHAEVNVIAHEREPLTPLDYAILGDHQDVAVYLSTENNAYTAKNLNICAKKIQSCWKNYCLRKSFNKPSTLQQIMFVKSDFGRKSPYFSSHAYTEGNSTALNNSGNSTASRHSMSTLPSPFAVNAPLNTLKRTNSSTTLSSSPFAPSNMRYYGASASKPKLSLSISNSNLFKETKSEAGKQKLSLSFNSNNMKGERSSTTNSTKSFKHVKSVRKSSMISTSRTAHSGEMLTKRIQRHSTNSTKYHFHQPIRDPTLVRENAIVPNNASNTENTHGTNNMLNDNIVANSTLTNTSNSAHPTDQHVENNTLTNSTSISELQPVGEVSGFNTDQTLKSSSSDSSIVFHPKECDIAETATIAKPVTPVTSTDPSIISRSTATPKIRIIHPDYTHDKPWNKYRRDQKRVQLIRNQTDAAIRIQHAFRSYSRRKNREREEHENNLFEIESYSSMGSAINHVENPEINGRLENPSSTCDEQTDDIGLVTQSPSEDVASIDDLKEVAALMIQLAWRQYVKDKLLRNQELDSCVDIDDKKGPTDVITGENQVVRSDDAQIVTITKNITHDELTNVSKSSNHSVDTNRKSNSSSRVKTASTKGRTSPTNVPCSLLLAQEVYCPGSTNSIDTANPPWRQSSARLKQTIASASAFSAARLQKDPSSAKKTLCQGTRRTKVK